MTGTSAEAAAAAAQQAPPPPQQDAAAPEPNCQPEPAQKRGQQHSEEVIAASKFSQKLIEQKERELQESIAINYTRIKDVEKELRALQMEVKLTAEPKKQALEMLRKKIEVQNTKVLAVWRRYDAAAQAFRQLEAELSHEESVKQQLCDELNEVVTNSVTSQLDRFEQLRVKLDTLNGGAGAIARSSSAPAQHMAQVQASASKGTPQDAGTVAAQALPHPQQQQQSAGGQQLPPPHAQQTQATAAAPEDAAAAVTAAKAAKADAADAAAAEAARSRHVQLPGRLRHAGAGGGQGGGRHAPHPTQLLATKSQQQVAHSSHVARDRDGRFAGFD